MKVKVWVDGGLILDGDVLKGAEEASSESRYVEAFALLHALIDWWMIDLYQLHEMSRGKDSQELHHEREYRFRTLLTDLRKMEVISDKERDKLDRFDALRNKIIHRLVMYGYQPYPRNRIMKSEVTQGFEEGKALAELLASKATAHA